MADTKISALTAATTLADTDELVIASAGASKKITGANLKASIPGAGIPETLFNAKGDLVAASAADTAGRLAVGSNGQVLTADSTQTLGIKWSAATGGGLVADTLWDAKGDLAVASAADTGGRLAVGSNGQVLTADSAQTLGVKWAAAGGGGGGVTEVAYAEFTSPVFISATAEASGATVVSAGAVTYTAVKHKIEFWCPLVEGYATTTGSMIINLWDASTNLGRMGLYEYNCGAVGSFGHPMYFCRYLTPTAASHTYIIKCWVTGAGASGSCAFKAGDGSTGTANMPGYIRVTAGG